MIFDVVKKDIFSLSRIRQTTNMFSHIFSSCILCVIVLFSAQPQSYADIITDGSLGSVAPLAGPDYQIIAELGQQRGGNLFHSFSQFNIAAGESGTFSGPVSISNILSRITGGSVSTIDGVLGAEIADADFFLSNPAGVMFGANSSLDISGSVSISTADYVVLDDLTQFMSTPPAGEILSTAAPAAFGFLDTPVGSIELQGSELTTGSGKNQNFIGAGIEADNVDFHAESGRISMISVASAGEVVVDTSNPNGFSSFGDLSILSNSQLDVSDVGGGAGTIFLRSNQLELVESSLFASVTSENGSGIIDIGASGGIIIDNSASIIGTTAGSAPGSSNGSGLEIQALSLSLDNTSLFDFSSSGAADAGSVTVDVSEEMVLRGGSTIDTSSSTSATGGTVDIKCQDLSLESGSTINTTSIGGSSGPINLNLEQDLSLATGSGIQASTHDSDGGNLLIQGRTASLDNSDMETGSDGMGNAGMIDIELLGNLELENESMLKTSSASTLGNSGDAGDISIQLAGDLVLSGLSGFAAVSNGGGQAGSVNVNADNVSINSGYINVSGKGSGDSGSIDISAENINLIGADLFNVEAEGTGQEGNIVLSVVNNLTFDLGTGEIWDFEGNIASGSVTKEGPGTLTLLGDSTVSNTTSVLDGTLEVIGNVDSSILVGSTAKLVGTGSVADTSVEGILAPGRSIGTLTLGSTAFAAGSQYIVETEPVGNSDSIIVRGTVDLGSADLDISFQSGSYAPRTQYLIIDNDGNDQVVGEFASVNTTNQPASSLVNIDNSGGDGNDVVVTLILIDEVTLPGLNGDTVTFQVIGEDMTAQSVTEITIPIPGTILSTPYGKVSYTVSAPSGGMVTIRLTFSTPLPDAFKVFSIDSSKSFSEISQLGGNQGYWEQIDSTTIDVTLKDNGIYDLDAALGVVDAQIVLATVRSYLLYDILPAIHEIAKQQNN